MNIRLFGACALLVIGCGQAPQNRPTTVPSSVTVELRGAHGARAQAMREAEDFVRAQGYADAAPSASGDAIVREGMEGTLAERRHMLEPRAVRAYSNGRAWVVVFRYQDSQLAGRGRALELRAGQTPAFVHQDLVLER